jgi:fumarylpyruvate hydrolase
MSFVINPATRVSLPVAGSDQRFPVHQLYCVGRNYADHAVEMGSDPDREPPFFFMKPDYAVLAEGRDMQYPALSSDVHHEVELVVALQSGGRDIPVEDAMSLVYGYAVGVDMTRRDLQGEAKEGRRPWEAGKVFPDAAPCSAVVPVTHCGELAAGTISLSVNGDQRQQGDINQMIWKVPEVISRLSTLFQLHPGDLVFTGTPAGVGPVERGDIIEARIEGLPVLSFKVSDSK